MIKKVLYSIFICLASFFLMSHNVSALELINDVDLINGNVEFQIRANSWNVIDGSCIGLNNAFENYISCNGNARVFDISLTAPSGSIQAGDWIVYEFFVNQNLNNVSNHINFYGMEYNGSNPVILAYTDIEEFNANTSKITLYIRSYGTFTDTDLRFKGKGSSSIFIFNPANGTNSQLQVRAGLASVFREKNPANYTGSINDVKNSVNSINNTLKEQQEQEKQDTNQAIDDSKNSSNSSSSDVQNNSSTQSLLSVITGFFGAITSSSPSSCVLTGQINEYLTPSFDLCQLDPPPALTALLSIPVSIALFFFAKHMLNKIIALIRSFQ